MQKLSYKVYRVADFDFYKQAQKYFQMHPAIVLGSGASAAFKLSGMGALATHLVSSIQADDESELKAWEAFKSALMSGKDLESALHEVRLSENLTKQVVVRTWELLNPEDKQVFYNSLTQNDFFPLSKLISGLFRSAINQIDIVTTNYDRLAEYAAEQAGFHHYTGFTHGYRRLQAPPDAVKTTRIVNILKVHGSLDWFSSPLGDVIGLNQIDEIPPNHQPQIVTPGIEKYSLTYKEPFRSIIQLADAAIRKNNSYLCVGFGFNDIHIQEKLIERCKRHDAAITLITWELSPASRKFLLSGEVKNFIAIERGVSDEQSIIYSSELDSPMTVDGDYWSLSGYLNLVM